MFALSLLSCVVVCAVTFQFSTDKISDMTSNGNDNDNDNDHNKNNNAHHYHPSYFVYLSI